MNDKKWLIFLVAVIVVLGIAAYVLYPRLFPKKAAILAPQVRQEPPVLIEVAPQKPAPQPPPPTRAKPPAPETAKATGEAPKERATPAPATPRRYSLEFPPFVTTAAADEHERRLKQAGLQTLRSTTLADDGLYTLIVGPLPSAVKASEAMAELSVRSAAPGSPREAEGGFVFSDGPYVLREVVQRAQEIRGKGYGVRIVQADGKASLYLIRTAARFDSAEAARLSGHYRKLGFSNRVVPSR